MTLLVSKLSTPSSTITAASVVSAVMVAFWAGMNIFVFPKAGYPLTADLVVFEGLVSTAASALAGYFKKENVLPVADPNPQEKQ